MSAITINTLNSEITLNFDKRVPVEYWKMKGGRTIAICNMETSHLINTIKMLRQQIDGSLHDDFCWDNIDAMEKELRKRGINYGQDSKRRP